MDLRDLPDYHDDKSCESFNPMNQGADNPLKIQLLTLPLRPIWRCSQIRYLKS